jgi:hypothetical protein
MYFADKATLIPFLYHNKFIVYIIFNKMHKIIQKPNSNEHLNS